MDLSIDIQFTVLVACVGSDSKITTTLSELYLRKIQERMSTFHFLFLMSLFNSEVHSAWVDVNTFYVQQPEQRPDREIRDHHPANEDQVKAPAGRQHQDLAEVIRAAADEDRQQDGGTVHPAATDEAHPM